jgi:hypothetical protein
MSRVACIYCAWANDALSSRCMCGEDLDVSRAVRTGDPGDGNEGLLGEGELRRFGLVSARFAKVRKVAPFLGLLGLMILAPSLIGVVFYPFYSRHSLEERRRMEENKVFEILLTAAAIGALGVANAVRQTRKEALHPPSQRMLQGLLWNREDNQLVYGSCAVTVNPEGHQIGEVCRALDITELRPDQHGMTHIGDAEAELVIHGRVPVVMAIEWSEPQSAGKPARHTRSVPFEFVLVNDTLFSWSGGWPVTMPSGGRTRGASVRGIVGQLMTIGNAIRMTPVPVSVRMRLGANIAPAPRTSPGEMERIAFQLGLVGALVRVATEKAEASERREQIALHEALNEGARAVASRQGWRLG